MSISPGFTAAEIREVVYEYDGLPYGQKAIWRVERGVSYKTLRRWQRAVFEGDLDRGLIPRHGSRVAGSSGKREALEKARAAERTALEKAGAAEREAHTAEVAKLSGRVRELEESNTALGKAIGLLHAMSEEEPADTPTTPDPINS